MLKITFTGYIGGDCRTKIVGDQVAITFSVGITKQFKNRQNEQVSKTTWVGCTIWKHKDNIGRIADFLKLGKQVLVEGEPSARGYYAPADPGTPKASLDCRVSTIELLGSAAPASTDPEPVPEKPAETKADDNDDLPF